MEKKQLIKIDFVNEFQITEKVKIELNNLLSICFPDTISNKRTYFKQLISAVSYCHRQGIVHRDLKL